MSRLILGFCCVVVIISTGQMVIIEAKSRLAQPLLQSAWQRILDGGSEAKGWPWADQHPVARLKVSRLNQDIVVLNDASGQSLAFSAGRVLNDGKDTTIIAGHRDTHFRFIKDLKLGDILRLQDQDRHWREYEVGEFKIVDGARPLMIDSEGDPFLALSTCYPFSTDQPDNNERLIVVAYPKAQ